MYDVYAAKCNLFCIKIRGCGVHNQSIWVWVSFEGILWPGFFICPYFLNPHALIRDSLLSSTSKVE